MRYPGLLQSEQEASCIYLGVCFLGCFSLRQVRGRGFCVPLEKGHLVASESGIEQGSTPSYCSSKSRLTKTRHFLCLAF